ncbi:Transcription initiation factor TFIID subunit 9 [Lecanora helva]
MAETNNTAPEPGTNDVKPANNQDQAHTKSLADPTKHDFPSQSDSGLSKRPRDARLLHMVLANYGVSAYQERVPLQLMDLAYRYTSSTLQDALHFTAESYGTTGPTSGTGKAGAHNDLSNITLSSLRLSIASRTHYQFNPTLPKEVYSEIAQERNRVALPSVSREWGIRLPPEQYCLTGVGWELKDEFDEEMDKNSEPRDEVSALEGEDMEEDNNDDEEVGKMEDIFGDDGDTHMED